MQPCAAVSALAPPLTFAAASLVLPPLRLVPPPYPAPPQRPTPHDSDDSEMGVVRSLAETRAMDASVCVSPGQAPPALADSGGASPSLRNPRCRAAGCAAELRTDRVAHTAIRQGMCNKHFREYNHAHSTSPAHRPLPPINLPRLVAPASAPFVPRKPFNELQQSQRYNRKSMVKASIHQHDVPLTALSPVALHPAEVQHLGPRERRGLREYHLQVPSDRTMQTFYAHMKQQFATKCRAFELGAYVADPVQLVRHVRSSSPLLTVCGDYGGGTTKLGCTYTDANKKLHFLPLYLIARKDNIESLAPLRGDYYPFEGESAHFPHVWAMLQSLLDASTQQRPCFLGGDWPFLNTVLGLQSPSALYPCHSCVACSDDFTATARPREAADRHSRTAVAPLLTCPPERIVPLPLHLVLGFGNRVLAKILSHSSLLQQSALSSAVSSVRQVHTRGCGGLADLHDLNGPELARFFDQYIPDEILSRAAEAVGIATRQQATANSSELQRLPQAFDWVRQLKSALLCKERFSDEDVWAAVTLVNEIIVRWTEVTGDHPFPKLHMLRHVAEFIERWRVLGAVSESTLEAAHAKCNRLYNDKHFNLGRDTNTRLLRTLESVIHDISSPLAHKVTG